MLAAADLFELLLSVATSKLTATLGVFALILVLARLKVPLALAVFAGAVALGLVFRRLPEEIFWMSLAGAVHPLTIGVAAATMILLAISETMRRSGQMAEIVTVSKGLFRRPAVVMAALPAMIGLLPMPGGALFSAPMVEAAAGKAAVSGDRLSAINYWFRHIWEHWWPLYPGVILAVALTESSTGAFVLHQFPLGISMAVGGLLIFRGAHPELHRGSPPPGAGTAWKLLRVTSTIWIILIVWLAAGGVLAVLLGEAPTGPGSVGGAVRRFVPLVAGLLTSLLWTIRMNRMSRSDVRHVVSRPSIYKMAVLVVAVMIFQHAIKQLNVAPQVAAELQSLNVSPIVVVALLPLIAGLVTGLAVGFVGTSFPIVLALVMGMPDHGSVRPYVALAYAFGHLGQMLSPLHVCHILSNRYFKTGFRPVYWRLLPSVGVTAALAAAYFVVLRFVVG